jgi:hypothetical protein
MVDLDVVQEMEQQQIRMVEELVDHEGLDPYHPIPKK